MSEAIAVSIISGGLTLLGVVVTTIAANDRTNAAIRTAQAVTDTKLENLTREVRVLDGDVREHNNFAKRLPVVEEQIKVINHRIADLEKGA